MLRRCVPVACQLRARLHLLRSGFHVADRGIYRCLDVRDELPDFTGRLGGALRQLPHFFRNDAKATAVFSGPGRFNGCIEGEQVRLFRKVADHVHDLSDLTGVPAQFIDTLSYPNDGRADLFHPCSNLLNSLLPFVGPTCALARSAPWPEASATSRADPET